MSESRTMRLHEPQVLIRQGLVSLLSDHSFAVLDGDAPATPFTVINASTTEGIAQIAEGRRDGSRVIAYGRPMTAPLALRSLDAGADGVLDDAEGIAALLLALESPTVPALSLPLAADVAAIRTVRASLATVTPREIEVLTSIAGGATVAEIASDLGIADVTVANHLQRSMAKLESPNRAAAVTRARALGLIS